MLSKPWPSVRYEVAEHEPAIEAPAPPQPAIEAPALPRLLLVGDMTKKYVYDIDLADSNHAATKVLSLVGTEKRVLEVGCASGLQSRILKDELRCAVTGIEVDADAAESARAYCEQLIVGNVETMDVGQLARAGKYDVVLFADVLEHLLDPLAALTKVAPLLTDDGYIVASIPNVAHESIILDLCHGKFDYETCGLLDNTHNRFFTKKTVYSLFEQAGYVIATLERVTHREVDTQARRVDLTRTERQILEFVRQSNPESDTFQFIVKAYKATAPAASHAQVLALEDRLAELERQLSSKTEQIERLNTDLLWLTSHPAYRFLRRVRNLARRRRAAPNSPARGRGEL
jgi:2-polyprenyl-3-methyl-5-hydroxy-6-metoxy-1,4-benzoquinol methylase